MFEDKLPEEYALELGINGRRGIKLICTRASLRELATGFLFNEGVIASAGEIASLDIDEAAGTASVAIGGDPALPERFIRASGLGGEELCDARELPRAAVGRLYTLEYIRRCAEEMDERAPMYAATGGVHASAIFDGERMLSMFEDIGRHNTLDKIAGDLLLRGLVVSDALLVTTGRISSDMVRKAAQNGARVIASFSRPTRRAYDMASAAGMTLLGSVKKDAVVYCGGERIV